MCCRIPAGVEMYDGSDRRLEALGSTKVAGWWVWAVSQM